MQNLKQFIWILSFLVMGSVTVARATSDSGFLLPIRATDAPDAGIVETVELYGASYALVIGIDEYEAGWPQLSNAVKDAKLVAAALKRKNFNVTLVLNPKSSDLEAAFKEFFVIKGQNPASRLFVWYAGHGHTENGEGYLVPVDATRPDLSVAQFRLKALSLRRFGDFVRLAESKHAFAVFDSCFAGTVFDSARALPSAAVTRATTLPVRQFLTSGDAGQTVSDDGMFRELFLRALEGEERADANGDGFITATEIGLHMSSRITNLTQSKQTPRYGKLRDKDWDRGDFVFQLAGKAPVGNDPETILWNLVQKTGQISSYEAFLRQFPRGRYTATARDRLAALRRDTNALNAAKLQQLEAERAQLERERRRLVAEASDAKQELEVQRQQLAALQASREQARSRVSRLGAEAAPWIPAGPVPYVPLPVGMEVNYGSWAFRVEESNGIQNVVRTRSNNFREIVGGFAFVGENLYSDWAARERFGAEDPRVTIAAETMKKLQAFWPLTVGKTVEFEGREYGYGGSFYDTLEDDWRYSATVSAAERLTVADQSFNTLLIETKAESTRGRKFDQSLWYDVDTGLVVKLTRKWSGTLIPGQTGSTGAGANSVKGTNPGDIQEYELVHFVFPPGHEVSKR